MQLPPDCIEKGMNMPVEIDLLIEECRIAMEELECRRAHEVPTHDASGHALFDMLKEHQSMQLVILEKIRQCLGTPVPLKAALKIPTFQEARRRNDTMHESPRTAVHRMLRERAALLLLKDIPSELIQLIESQDMIFRTLPYDDRMLLLSQRIAELL